MKKTIERFIESFNPFQASLADKKDLSDYLFENDNLLNPSAIKAIYQTGSYRADRIYFDKVTALLEAEYFSELSSLSTKIVWGNDELAELPIEDRIQVYLILFKNETLMLKAQHLKYDGSDSNFIIS